jgi:predicted RNase H-like HicB family nuclease
MTPRYHINVFWSDEDRCWIADVPDLKTCAAHGGTPEEAVAEVLVAMQAWLDVAHEHGQPAPEPRYKPAAHAAA